PRRSDQADPLRGGPHPRRPHVHHPPRGGDPAWQGDLQPRRLVPPRADGPGPARRVPNDPLLPQCVVVYASDLTRLDTATLPHAIAWNDPGYVMASLDHPLWFPPPVRAGAGRVYAPGGDTPPP